MESAGQTVTKVRGLWSVKMQNSLPSTKCQRYITSSSQLKVLYRVSAGLSFLEMGHPRPPTDCWRTAPTAVSEASVTMQVVPSGCGWTKRMASARASLIEEKASSVQEMTLLLSFDPWSKLL